MGLGGMDEHALDSISLPLLFMEPLALGGHQRSFHGTVCLTELAIALSCCDVSSIKSHVIQV